MARAGRSSAPACCSSSPRCSRCQRRAQGFALAPNGERRALTADELKNLTGSAVFGGPLVDFAAKGVKVRVAGREAVEGRDTHHLELAMAGGQLGHESIDAITWLDMKWAGSLRLGGREVHMWTLFRDFHEVGGLSR